MRDRLEDLIDQVIEVAHRGAEQALPTLGIIAEGPRERGVTTR